MDEEDLLSDEKIRGGGDAGGGGGGASTTSVVVRAHAFAATFRLRELMDCFTGAELRLAKDQLLARFTDGSTAIAFDFGALVFFDGEQRVRAEVLRAIARRIGETQPPRNEDFLVEISPDVALPEVRFDRVIVGKLPQPARQVIALLVAQSAAMDYYEEDVGEILAQTEKITCELGRRGRLRRNVRQVVRFIGSCIETKNDIVETLSLFDKPEATWEDETLDRLYTRLRMMLEIDDRFRALEYRLRHIQDTLVLLVDLSRQQSTFYLESSVLAVIVLEVVLMAWQLVHPH